MSPPRVKASKWSWAEASSQLRELAQALLYEAPSFNQRFMSLTVIQTVAGVFALLNDFRLSQGKTALGFINPLIYSTASSGFNDITSGSNPGCGTNG